MTLPGVDFGVVPGHLGWEVDKRPCRFSKQAGVLRVATSLGNTWGVTFQTRLSLPRSASGENGVVLREVAFLDHIGLPGEQLYAVRYVGTRAYLVTFRITDPLYVFDLLRSGFPCRVSIVLQIADGHRDDKKP